MVTVVLDGDVNKSADSLMFVQKAQDCSFHSPRLCHRVKGNEGVTSATLFQLKDTYSPSPCVVML